MTSVEVINKVSDKSSSDDSKEVLRLISGSSHLELAKEISQLINLPLTPIIRKKFADGELYIRIQESVRGCDVYLIQPICKNVNDQLIELLMMVDACKRASAKAVTAIVPYYAYARFDCKISGRESITAKLVANLLASSGVDRIVSIDLHSNQIQGFFDIPLDHLYSNPVLVEYLKGKALKQPVVVSPDIGGVARARAFAKLFNNSPLAIVDDRNDDNSVKASQVIGDIVDKDVIIVDDIIDSGNTILRAAEILKREKASKVYVCATHGVLSGSVKKISSSGLFEEILLTNTIPLPPTDAFPQLSVVSIAPLLGEAIRRIHKHESISQMF